MTQDVERLDFSKPPPGYTWDERRTGYLRDIYDDLVGPLADAWKHYQARFDPPGMWSGFYGRLPDLKVYTPRMGRVHGMELIVPESEHSTPELAKSAGREAAWIRYERWCASGEWFDMGAMR